jgi:arginine/lysine/ornithine decarboxylase
MVDTSPARAYTSWWQARSDTWSRLEEASGQLAGTDVSGQPDSGLIATFVTPCPPGFPVLVPGQLFSPQILEFMRSLDTPEVHGYDPQAGYRVYTAKALEIAQDERA